jgi:hypothetical protein
MNLICQVAIYISYCSHSKFLTYCFLSNVVTLLIYAFFFSYIAAVDIYAGVAASLAERKRGGQLTEFFRNIKGTIDDDDMDEVI